MAEKILLNVLSSKITIEQLFNWLTADNFEKKLSPDIIENECTRSEFISYFLSFLREQCESLLQNSKKPQDKPVVKALTKSCPIETIIGHTGNRSHEEQTQLEPMSSPVVPPVSSASYQTHYEAYAQHASRNGVPLSYQAPEQIDSQTYYGRSNINILQHPSSVGPQSAMNSIPAYYRQLSDRYPYNPYNNPPHHSVHPMDAQILHRSTNAGPSFTQPISSFNISSPPDELDKSLTNIAIGSSSPEKSDSNIQNSSIDFNMSIPFSPVSPLYTNISASTPKGKTHYNPNVHDNSNNSINQCNTSTPKNISGSGQKGEQCRQSLCLGDFLIAEPTGSKKSTKKYSKIQFGRKGQPSDSISPANGTKSKRRINPTRLNTSGNKESQGSDVFGVISRPSAANPQFIEAPSTDKSEEEASFNVERNLLKLERQRQPKNTATPDLRNFDHKFTSNTQSTLTNASCFTVDFVENIDALNILAHVYSDILNYNLMINPMTELYFLVTLLTTQYKTPDKIKTDPDNIAVISNVLTSSGELLETLKNDLGCAELPDEILSGNSDSMIHGEESIEKSVTDEEKEPLTSIVSKNTQKHQTRGKQKFDLYLGNPQNCVYFATKVLCNQHVLLSSLDRATLKVLCENQQIAAFQPSLQTFLNEIYHGKCSQTNRMRQNDSGSLQSNVCFQLDTDNRDKFPSIVAFSSFRKQRDLFYEILKDWEDHHLLSDWSFTKALNHKIKMLLTIHDDAVNYCHFAKLFISQLLASSLQSGQLEDPMNDESLSFLQTLTNVNPGKLLQLKERLVTPMTSVGPVPQPVFPGVQEFYKEFILHASIWTFYVVLQTCFIREIMELNETPIAENEIDSTGTRADEVTKQRFIACVSSLRLLAKFVSFTQSLPFKSMENSSQFCLTQIQLRSSVLPPLDLRGCLLDAIIRRRLSLTVPWIVQYMAMLDTVTLRLPHYMKICEILYYIYRASTQYRVPNSDKSMSPQTSILMIFTIGWLFELPKFPRDLYSHWQLNFHNKKLKILSHSYREQIENDNPNSVNLNSSKEFVKYNSGLDMFDVVDDRALYECCPFLVELKLLLISGNSTIGNNTVNRHITPVSSQLSELTFGVKYKNLQMQLEEAFFHGQPSSTRKTVDFISERVASNCVKYICYTIIPSVKERVITAFIKSKNEKNDIDGNDKEDDDGDDDDVFPESPVKAQNEQKDSQKIIREREQQELAVLLKENVKKECAKITPSMCEVRIMKSIESLLADDVPAVKETCLAIAKRTATDRIEQWIDSHVVESLFLKNIELELKTVTKGQVLQKTEKNDIPNSDVPSATDVIGMIRGSMWELLEHQSRWSVLSVDTVIRILTGLHQILANRSDLQDYLQKNLYTISLEYCLLLTANRQDLLTPEIKQLFINIWKIDRANSGKPKDLFARVISPRNIRMLTHSSNAAGLKAISWLLTALLNENLLKINGLSDQCVALFRQEWPIPILKQLSECLKPVISDYKCVNNHTKKIQIFLNWVADTCDEMDT